MNDTPADYAAPDWSNEQRVHNWRNYITDEVAAMWHTFTDEQKQALARQAQGHASNEEWE